jgi:AraC-like DNA-binding protein
MTHGLFAYVFSARVPFRELMTHILYYMQVRIPLMVLSIRHESNYIAIGVSYRHPLQETESFVTQVFLSSMYTLVAMVTKHCTLHFENRVLSDTRGIEKIISAPIEIGHHCNEIRIYAAKQTHHPSSSSIEKTEMLNDHDLIVRIRTYLLSYANMPISAEDTAAHFKMSVNALHHRLSNNGTSFNEIRSDLHRHTASPVVHEKEDDFEDHGLAVRMRLSLNPSRSTC